MRGPSTGSNEANAPAQAFAASDADATAATVDTAIAAVDHGAEPGSRADAAGKSASRARRGRGGSCAGGRVSARQSETTERTAHDAPDSNAAEARGAHDDAPDQTDFTDYSTGSGDGDWGGGPSSDDDDFYPQQVAVSTLRDHLNEQLATMNLPLRDRQIVAALIDALDEDGYCRRRS